MVQTFESGGMEQDRQRFEGVAPAQAPVQADDEIDLLQLLGSLWRGKWIILLCSVLALVIGGYYAYAIAIPKFSATARLAVQSRGQKVVDLESVLSGVSTDQAAINTELEVIRSRGLLERLVADMNLIADPEFNLALRETSPVSRDALTRLVAGYLSISMPEQRTPTSEEIHIATVNAVSDAIAVSSQRNTFLIDIRVTSQERRRSAEMANRLAQIYLDDQIGIKFAATEYAIDWLSGRVAELEHELNQKEDEIKDLRSETELVSVEALGVLHVRAKDIRDRLADAQLATNVIRERYRTITELVTAAQIDKIAAFMNDPTLNRHAGAAKLGDVAAAQAFKKRFETLVQREKLNTDRQVLQQDTLQTSLVNLQEQISLQSADLARLNQLAREADATRILYETFLTRLKETSVQIGLQQADSRILSSATPGQQVAPRGSMILALSLVLGGMLGCGITLARQLLHSGFRTAEELEFATGHSVLGQIPIIPIRGRKGLIPYLGSKTTSASAEAIRNLRTSILLSNIDHPPKVILSASAIPGEGKTTQSIGLAKNFADLGKKVLLVEGDIRRRVLSEYFIDKPPGSLVSVVSGKQPIDEAVMHEPTLGVDILVGDKSSINAADLFSSETFREFVDTARVAYDVVIIDTPPVLVVPDSRVIGQVADAIVFSVKWDATGKSQVLDGLRQFSSAGLHVSGLILGQIDARGMKRYGYGGKYGAYSRYGRGYYDT